MWPWLTFLWRRKGPRAGNLLEISQKFKFRFQIFTFYEKMKHPTGVILEHSPKECFVSRLQKKTVLHIILNKLISIQRPHRIPLKNLLQLNMGRQQREKSWSICGTVCLTVPTFELLKTFEIRLRSSESGGILNFVYVRTYGITKSDNISLI